MSGPNSGYALISPISVAIPKAPVDLPVEDQRKLTALYTSIYTILEGLRDYAGIGNWSSAHVASMDPEDFTWAGLNNRIYLEAAEAIDTNDIVDINSSGQAVKASGSNVCGMMIGKSVAAGAKCEVLMFFGVVKNFSGLTPGAKYYVGGIPGKLATSGVVPVGKAISTKAMFINISL